MNQQTAKKSDALKTPDLISVVISAYNHEHYVQQTLLSILNQTYSNIELIITNDGSPDHTAEKISAMLPQLQNRLTHIEFVDKENEGVIKSLNLCLSIARGKYVYFIASDDVAKPEAIEVLHRFLSAHADYGLAVGDNEIIDEQGTPCFWNSHQEIIYQKQEAYAVTFADYLQKIKKIHFNGPDFGSYPALLGGNHVPNGFLIRKSILDQIGGYSEEAPLEDLHLMLQISKIAKLKFIDQVLFGYRWHDSNTISQTELMQKYEQETIAYEIPYAKKHGLLRFIPYATSKKILGMPVFEYKRNRKRTKVTVCKFCLFKKMYKENRTTISIMCIPVWSIRQKTIQGRP